MRNKIKYLFLAAALFCFCVNANAEELTATLGNIIGEVEIIRAGETEAIPAETGMVVSVGDIIETGDHVLVDGNEGTVIITKKGRANDGRAS